MKYKRVSEARTAEHIYTSQSIFFTPKIVYRLSQHVKNKTGREKEGFPGGSNSKESSCNLGDLDSIPGWGRLEEGMATGSSILAYRIPMDRKAWQTIVHGVTESQI